MNRKQMLHALLGIGLALFVISANSANVPIAKTDKASKQMPTGLWQAFSEAQHLIQPVQGKDTPMRFKGQSPSNGFSFSFDPKGITYRSGTQDSPWKLSMELTSYGSKEHQQSMPTKKMHLDGNKVTYDRGKVEEWYINTSAGLEQGFTLKAPPSQAIANQQIVLDIKLSGNLNPRWQQKGQSLAFYTEKGDYAFNYAKLSVIDAEGKELPAQMALVDKKLQLSFNPENARWPIIVDPLSYTETILSGTDNDAEANAFFGYSVAVSGNTAVIGAYSDDGACSETEINCGAAYVFYRSVNRWNLQQKLVAGDPEDGASFGSFVALDNITALIGAKRNDGACSGTETNCGAAYVFVRSGKTWLQQQKLVADDPNGSASFGNSVALDGDTALIAASDDGQSCNGTDVRCGSAYVFTRTSNTWSQQQKLTAEIPENYASFGSSVALNGNTALVGSFLDDTTCSGTDINCGAAYVYTRSADTWSLQQKLAVDDSSYNDQFGTSVALDGDTALVSAVNDDASCNGTNINCGAGYIFIRSSNTWAVQQKLVADDPEANSYFGWSTALSDNTILIGALWNDSTCSGTDINCGAAYVFSRSGNLWTQQQKLHASAPGNGDEFGRSIALDGDTALIGSGKDDTSCSGNGINCGAAFIYTYSRDSWFTQQKITAENVVNTNNFGIAVALDGDTALIGADKDNGTCNGTDVSCGAVYVFIKSANDWSLQQKIAAKYPEQGSYFGTSVALDGNTALIGASDEDASCNGTDIKCGAVYVFTRYGTSWVQQQKIIAEYPNAYDIFGASIALDGNTALIGCLSCGGAYLFTQSNNHWTLIQKIIDPGVFPYSGEAFGQSVALSGNTALISDTLIRNENGNYGAVYVYTPSSTFYWSLQQKLVVDTPDITDSFGDSMALDTDTALIGATQTLCDSGLFCGAAYVYTRADNYWSQHKKLVANDSSQGANFGHAVALNKNTAVIGAFKDTVACQGTDTSCGAAYIFNRVANNWQLQQKLIASTPSHFSGFGKSLALDGHTIIIGSPSASSSCSSTAGPGCGRAYVFQFDCGFGKDVMANRWTMVGLPCDTSDSTVEEVFGDNLNPGDYGQRWVVYERDYSNVDSYKLLQLSSVLTNQQQGLWLLSLDSRVWNVNGTETPVNTNNPNCPTENGCYEIDLIAPQLNSGLPRYNLVGHKFPYPIEWQSVRFEVDGLAYTPSQAEEAGLVSKNMWLYNGNVYDVYDDATPGMEGVLNSHYGLWTAVLGNARGSIVKLLVPVESIIVDAPPPPP